MDLKITKERVLEAAAKCSQAKETLKTLFPEVFVEPPPTIYGVCYVQARAKDSYKGNSRYTAISVPSMVRLYEKEFGYREGSLVAFVPCPNTSEKDKLNGWSYGSWATFHSDWIIV